MELTSLNKLRGGTLMKNPHGENGIDMLGDGDGIADKIQAEADALALTSSNGYGWWRIPNEMAEWCCNHGCGVEGYIDHFYLARPLFEDGEPVQFGDMFNDGGDIYRASYIQFNSSGEWEVASDGYEFWHQSFICGNRLKRPPASDTQELIDTESTLCPRYYCEHYDLAVQDYPDDEDFELAKIKHLLKRQREVCEREREV